MQTVLRIPVGLDVSDTYVPVHPSLRKLLHAEKAAALTYELAMHRCIGPWTGERFAELCASHASSAQALEEHCQLRPSPWHCDEESVDLASADSPSAHGIAALQNREVELAVAYHRALQDASVPEEVRETIARALLPTAREHILALAELLLQE